MFDPQSIESCTCVASKAGISVSKSSLQPPSPCPKRAPAHGAHTEVCGYSSRVMPVITHPPHGSLSSLSLISSSSSGVPRAVALLLPLHWPRAVWALLLLSFPAPLWAEGRREGHGEKAELSCPWGAAPSCSLVLGLLPHLAPLQLLVEQWHELVF